MQLLSNEELVQIIFRMARIRNSVEPVVFNLGSFQGGRGQGHRRAIFLCDILS